MCSGSARSEDVGVVKPGSTHRSGLDPAAHLTAGHRIEALATTRPAKALSGSRIVHSAMRRADNNPAGVIQEPTRYAIKLNRHMGTSVEPGTRLGPRPERKGWQGPVRTRHFKPQGQTLVGQALKLSYGTQSLPIRHEGSNSSRTQTPSRAGSTAQALASQWANSGTLCTIALG